MGRALFTAFVHKHAKVRIAGLNALFNVLLAGQWKTSYEVFDCMVGFRDPNIVPIKDFFETSTRVNYMAMFVTDRSVQVRECFFKTMAKILMDLPDRWDHEGRIFPYLLSGLFDKNDGIRTLVFELIEELGHRYEEHNEEKLREIKQFGYKPEWSYEGKIEDKNVDLPFPIAHRPRMGARILVRSYVRRYMKAIQNEIGDWNEEHAERTTHLLVYSICYVEEFMTQYLDHLLISMYKACLIDNNKLIMKNIRQSLRLIGRYCLPKSFSDHVIKAIRNELAGFYTFTGQGSLKAFGHLFAGSIELLQPGMDISRNFDVLKDFINAVKDSVIPSMDIESADSLVETLEVMINEMIKKKDEGVDIRTVEPHVRDLLDFLISAQTAYMSFVLQRKPDPENIVI